MARASQPLRWLHYAPAAVAALALMPAANAGTASAYLRVTAQVADTCRVDSTVADLVSVDCALDTPLVISPADSIAGASGLLGPAAAPGNFTQAIFAVSAANTLTPSLAAKLCNFLGSAALETASFDEYSLDISRGSNPKRNRYSTYEVCF